MIGFCLFMVICDSIAKFMSKEIDVLVIVWYRYVFHTIGFVSFAAVIRLRKPEERLVVGSHKLQFARGLLLILSTMSFFYAIAQMPLAESLALLYIFPILSIVFSIYFLKEKINGKQWFAILLGFVGIVIVLQPKGEVFNVGLYYALFSGLLMAGYTVLTKAVSSDSHPVSSSIYTGCIGILLIPLVPGFTFPGIHLTHILLAAAMGFSAAIGHYFLFSSLTKSPASVVAPFAYLEIVFASIAGLILFDDMLSLSLIIGIALICLCGSALARIDNTVSDG